MVSRRREACRVRASRLVSILLLLQTRAQMTAQELAEELEVSVRTIYRDMEALATAGVPLYGRAGHEGGYRLVEGYRTRLTGLTAGEADSLPYGLVLKAGRWYVVAATSSAPRTYRVSRIVDCELLEETFERDATFDFAGYWQHSPRHFEERRHIDRAIIRLSPAAFGRLPEVAEPAVADAAGRSARADGEAGSA